MLISDASRQVLPLLQEVGPLIEKSSANEVRNTAPQKPKEFSLAASSWSIGPVEAQKYISRLAALQTELSDLGDGFLNGQPPHAVIKKRTSRYRMPRHLKQHLINRFVAQNVEYHERPKVMIVAAHQDDESIGAGARLCTLSDAWVVHVTDGAPANPGVLARNGFDSREEYAEARRKELNAALDIAGVLPEHRLCLNYVDGEASLLMVDLVLRLADLIDNIRPDIVITHPYEGGHTDHDATAFAVHLACGLLRRENVRPPAVMEMTSYYRSDNRRIVHDFLPHKAADKERRVIVLDEELRARKRQMYQCFATQRSVLNSFTTEIERFRPAPRYNFTLPPHEGELNYERFGEPYRGHRWRRDAEQALADLRLRKSA